MKRARWMLVVAGIVGVGVLGYFFAERDHHLHAVSSSSAGAQVATASVERRTISSRTEVNGSLGYAGDYSVVNQLAGYFTWLPSADEAPIVAEGDVLYRVGTLPVVLLYGSVPAWRDLAMGVSGDDVAQLNDDLIRLGFLDGANLPAAATFGPATKAAVEALQRKIGASPSGALPLGNVVFLPSRVRVVSVLPALGARAETNAVIMKATSTSRQVAAHLSASQIKRVKIGEEVTITLNLGGPDQQAIGGTVSRIATTSDPGSGANGDTPTFEVDIIPTNRSPVGDIDQMPVQVGITNATAENALVVPVTALLSMPDRGHAVEMVGPGGSRSLLSVELGVFDDADGLVQVRGEGLKEGDRIVVPSL